jgi:hypothetical protein
MTDAAWARGMADLWVAFPGRGHETGELSAARATVYRQHLDDLTDQQWFHAVGQALERDEWFPTIARLREYAAGWVPPTAGYLPPARRTEEEAERDRESARRGLALIRAAVAARLPELSVAPESRRMPFAAPYVVDREAMAGRIEELSRQRAEILRDHEEAKR